MRLDLYAQLKFMFMHGKEDFVVRRQKGGEGEEEDEEGFNEAEVLSCDFGVCRTLRVFVIVDVLSHLPDLHNVVFRHRADDPGLVGVPREV